MRGEPRGGSSEPTDEEDTGGETDGEPDGTASGFLGFQDFGGIAPYCSLYDQDCPDGEKCTVWASSGGNWPDSSKCVPVHPQPDAAGEPCWAEEGRTGVDSCEFGAFCWDVDPETNMGMCVSFCGGGDINPTYERPNEACSGGKDFQVCLPVCDPQQDDCPVGCACYGFDQTFQCAPDASGDMGAVGDPCEFINACDRGTACIGAGGVPDCTGSSGCCSSYCTVGDDSPCLEGQQCASWFEEGTAPPGFEEVGVCIIPLQ